MTVIVTNLVSGTGTGSQVEVYVVPANTSVVVKRWSFNNTTAGALTATVVTNDGSSDREMITQMSIAARTPYTPDEINGITINAGGSIKINAAVGITYWLSGLIVTQQG